MTILSTEGIVLSAMRYGETLKIIRLATREYGVQSAIAKGALRPRSRFGAAVQVLSRGQVQLLPARSSDLHTLTAFDLLRTCATLSLRAGMNPLHLQALPGRRTLEMTHRYLRMIEDDLVDAHR